MRRNNTKQVKKRLRQSEGGEKKKQSKHNISVITATKKTIVRVYGKSNEAKKGFASLHENIHLHRPWTLPVSKRWNLCTSNSELTAWKMERKFLTNWLW